MVRFDLVWFGLVWFELVWFGLVRFGSVQFGLVLAQHGQLADARPMVVVFVFVVFVLPNVLSMQFCCVETGVVRCGDTMPPSRASNIRY